jgi:hypothetical protein
MDSGHPRRPSNVTRSRANEDIGNRLASRPQGPIDNNHELRLHLRDRARVLRANSQDGQRRASLKHVRLAAVHPEGRTPSNSPAPPVRFSAPSATSQFDAVSREESQPPTTFLRSSAVCTSTSLPALFHAGATHGIQRAGAPPMNHLLFTEFKRIHAKRSSRDKR